MIETVKKFNNFTWYHVSNLTAEDNQILVGEHRLTAKIIGYAIDYNESVRMAYDVDADESLMVIDVISYRHDVVETRPIGLLFAHGDLYTFSHSVTDYIKTVMLDPKNRLHPDNDKNLNAIDFAMTGLRALMTRYVSQVTEINRNRRVIQEQLGHQHKRTTKQMNDLLRLQTQMIYIQNSLANNHVMINEFKQDFKAKLSHVEVEHIDDVRIEIGQAEHMADIAIAVINSVSDAYGNLSNRDLNWTMKVLTVYSIVLTVPTIVSGFYGENVKWLPFADTQDGWWITLVITLFFMAIVSLILALSGFFRK
ncbi:magnesium transporter CorA family protein [Leuconostoc miyukkimchii]|mgnify:CR=1 FL=1|uniref:magnesium transporter CorA family protein n=1 Tax=Leuconostoc miyukkimchii TaxID=910540 RepID=UPI001C7D3F60|nr:magnesium transporter CorA family protein [Leuconostoc miyukkimchii]